MLRTQANTFLSIETPLGPHALLLEGMVGVERISRLFHFELDLLSHDHEIPFEKIVGQPVTITLQLASVDQPQRYIHGHVSHFSQLRGKHGYAYYRAQVVPWLWFLTRTTDCRIFQQQKVPEIIEVICADHGFHDIKNSLEGDFETLEYCVQYRESDFAFISRLMEHHGISYYFEHQKDKHVMVLANSTGGYTACPGQKAARYKEDGRVTEPLLGPGVVTDLRLRQEVRPTKVTYRDYNFERPQQSLEVEVPGTVKKDRDDPFEVYDYHPGRYLQRGGGESLAKLRMQELEATHWMANGQSCCRAFLPGYTFDLAGHHRTDANRKYLLVEVRHSATAGGYVDETPHYHNEFACIPAKTLLRPQKVTPRPIVEGPQTALVVGEDGEEIYTDKEGHGRVKIQFHWDREGEKDEESSCWVRVSQGWAGKGFGIFFLPRVGQEVIVDFLEGDPDQPILTGAVYNAHQTPPYPLPAERTKSTIRTNSYKGSGFNELRFEDKGGSEEIFLHAQKDLNEVVGHNHSTTVKVNESSSAGANQSFSAGANQSLSAGANQSLSAGANQTVTVKKDQTMTVQDGKCTTTVATGSYSVGAKQAVSLSSTDATLSAVAKAQVSVQSQTAGVDLKAKTLLAGEAESKATLKAPDVWIGDKKITVEGTEIEIKGSAKITLQVGGCAIKIEPSGITISGTKITSAASGTQEISGALVKIN